MSVVRVERRRSVRDILAAKGKTPIVCLTAYTAPMAKTLDPHVDLLLVGDSLGMVVYGFTSTLPVTLDMMIQHAAAVVRGSSKALVVVDLPFATYQESPEVAFRNAARSIARLYDLQADPARIDRMTFESPSSGGRVSRLWQLPRSRRDLTERRAALEVWARSSARSEEHTSELQSH